MAATKYKSRLFMSIHWWFEGFANHDVQIPLDRSRMLMRMNAHAQCSCISSFIISCSHYLMWKSLFILISGSISNIRYYIIIYYNIYILTHIHNIYYIIYYIIIIIPTTPTSASIVRLKGMVAVSIGKDARVNGLVSWKLRFLYENAAGKINFLTWY